MRTYYKAYLLRLQRIPGQPHWRATLENAHSAELIRFANERELFRYLIQVLTIPPPGFDEDGGTNDPDLEAGQPKER